MMTRAAILRAGAAGALMMSAGAAAQPVLDFGQAAWWAPNDWSDSIGSAFGNGLQALPDIDNDGVTDLAISIVLPRDNPGVWIVSGATGERLLTIDTLSTNAAVPPPALLRDQSTDGQGTLAIFEVDLDAAESPATVVFVDLETGTVRTSFPMPFPDGLVQLGRSVAPFGVGDSDGDGVEDLAVICRGFRDLATGRTLSAVTALSGASGDLLWRRIFEDEWIAIGAPGGLARIDDQNGDGTEDLAFVRSDAISESGPVAIEIISSADGSTIRSLDPPVDALSSFGASLAQTSAGLLAIGQPTRADITGRVTLHDITTGAVVETLHAFDFRAKNFGWDIIAGTDFSGDGEPDLVISAPGTDNFGTGIRAAVYVLDESDLSFHWGVLGGVLTNDNQDLGWHMARVEGRSKLTALALAAPGAIRRGGLVRPESGIVNLYDAPGPCYADLTGDGAINGADLGVLLGQWGPDGSSTGFSSPANFNSDRRIDAADLSYLIASWGICPD